MIVKWLISPQTAWAAPLLQHIFAVCRPKDVLQAVVNRSNLEGADVVLLVHSHDFSGSIVAQPSPQDANLKIFVSGEPLPVPADGYDIVVHCWPGGVSPATTSKTLYVPQYVQSMYCGRASVPCLIRDSGQVPRGVTVTKTRFCAYLYYQCYPHREEWFQRLSRYKAVDALGRCKGGGCQAPDQQAILRRNGTMYHTHAVEEYRPYKFVLAVENKQLRGYISEKIMNPLLAWAIPIYIGAEDVGDHFNPAAFVDASRFSSPDSVIEQIKKIDTDDTLWHRMLAEPIWRSNKPSPWIVEGDSVGVRQLQQCLAFRKTACDWVKRVLYINNTRDVSRWCRAVARMEAIDWADALERVTRPDGMAMGLATPTLAALKKSEPMYNCTTAEISTLAAHMSAWRQIAGTIHKSAMVWDDDADIEHLDPKSLANKEAPVAEGKIVLLQPFGQDGLCYVLSKETASYLVRLGVQHMYFSRPIKEWLAAHASDRLQVIK